MRRYLVALLLFLSLSACGDATRNLAGPVEPIGDFQIGHIGVVSPNLQKLLVSHDATEREWIDGVTEALSQRFDRFEGGKYYHFGVSIEAYSLPLPIIPGKSALELHVTVWDDTAHAKMNEAPKAIQVIRLIEVKMASTKESQMQWLVAQAANDIEVWMREMQVSDGWFGGVEASSDSAADVPGSDAVSEDIEAVSEDIQEAEPIETEPIESEPVPAPTDVPADTDSAASVTPTVSQ